jgi:hypothetical protein
MSEIKISGISANAAQGRDPAVRRYALPEESLLLLLLGTGSIVSIVSGVLLIGPSEFVQYKNVGGGILIGVGLQLLLRWQRNLELRREQLRDLDEQELRDLEMRGFTEEAPPTAGSDLAGVKGSHRLRQKE